MSKDAEGQGGEVTSRTSELGSKDRWISSTLRLCFLWLCGLGPVIALSEPGHQPPRKALITVGWSARVHLAEVRHDCLYGRPAPRLPPTPGWGFIVSTQEHVRKGNWGWQGTRGGFPSHSATPLSNTSLHASWLIPEHP